MLRMQHFSQMFSNSVGLSGGNHFWLVGFAFGSVVLVVLMFRA
jgi:hypothetical protein